MWRGEQMWGKEELSALCQTNNVKYNKTGTKPTSKRQKRKNKRPGLSTKVSSIMNVTVVATTPTSVSSMCTTEVPWPYFSSKLPWSKRKQGIEGSGWKGLFNCLLASDWLIGWSASQSRAWLKLSGSTNLSIHTWKDTRLREKTPVWVSNLLPSNPLL